MGFQIRPAHKEKEEKNYLNFSTCTDFFGQAKGERVWERNDKKPDKKRKQNHVVIMITVILPHAQLHSLSNWTFNSFSSVAGVKNIVTLIKNHETIVFLSTGQMASHNKKYY